MLNYCLVFKYCFCFDDDGILRFLWYFVIVCWESLIFFVLRIWIIFWFESGFFLFFCLIKVIIWCWILLVEMILLLVGCLLIVLVKKCLSLNILKFVWMYFLLIFWLIVDLCIFNCWVIFCNNSGCKFVVFFKKKFVWCLIMVVFIWKMVVLCCCKLLVI